MSIRTWLIGVLSPNNSLRWPLAALLGMSFLPFVSVPGVEAKTPGSTYCYYGTCHRVKTLSETQALVGKDEVLQSSFYDDCSNDRYNPCGLTSSGEVFRARDADNAASPVYPDGTTLLVRNPENQESAVVRVNNAGPYWGKRRLDVSRGVAEKLGFKKRGVASLEVRVLKAPTPAEARYKERRTYDAVPGYIGRFASVDAASVGTTAFTALAQATTEALFTPVVALADVLTNGAQGVSEADTGAGYATEIRAAMAKSSVEAKKTRVASSRKAKAKRYASKAGKKRYASKSYGKKRYAKLASKRGYAKVASKSYRKARRLAASRRDYQRDARRYASRARAASRKYGWTSPRRDGRGRTAQRHGARYARL